MVDKWLQPYEAAKRLRLKGWRVYELTRFKRVPIKRRMVSKVRLLVSFQAVQKMLADFIGELDKKK